MTLSWCGDALDRRAHLNGLTAGTRPETAEHPEGLFLTTGNVNFALTADGSEQRLFSGPGTVTDVCAVLAP
ncbi:hypothetical protein [Arthrobacter sedimenti]|uniref:hypothetical protein n=1 Tax=Arthrobacter sedimenti TaxID=2694931 RepID=UPI000B353F6C|nr:hypothetical protein [Arthrobacter sedimenti]